MRNPDRIKFVLRLLEEEGLPRVLSNKIRKQWNKNPDMRLFQLLSNYFNEGQYTVVYNIVSKIPGQDNIGWGWEEEDLFEGGKLLWGVRTDKDGRLLNKPYTAQLEQLTPEHLRAIIETQALSDKYFYAIVDMLDIEADEAVILYNMQDKLRKEKEEIVRNNIAKILFSEDNKVYEK